MYNFTLILTLWLLINVFSTSDLFIFYIFFEAIVIPMFILIVFEAVVLVRFMQLISFFFTLC